VVLLIAAPKLIKELNWLALLAGLVAAILVYWVALAIRTSPRLQTKVS
jgi:ATP synthase protein I